MSSLLSALDQHIAAASLPEIFRAIRLEAAYQQLGAPGSRRAWYEATVLGWPWTLCPPCRVCGANRYAGVTHFCPTAFQQAEAARRTQGAST